MGTTIRVIILNTVEDVAADLRAVLLAVPGVKIIAEIDEPALLEKTLQQFPAEVLLVHLDPNPAGMMELIEAQLEARKEQIASIGMTEERDAELVVRAMRAGMREFLWKPFPPEQLAEIVQRVAAAAPNGAKKLGRVFSVVGSAGGVGCTTLAVNLAAELAQLDDWHAPDGKVARPRVAIVDMDFRFGQVAMQFDAQPNYTIADLCETAEQLDPRQLERAVVQHATGVHLLARPTELAQAERINAAQAASALAQLQEHYDFIVVDLPARLDPTSQAVCDMSDTYLLVVQLVVPAVRNADRILHELARTGYANERIRVVCSRTGRESGHLEVPDVEATLKRKLEFIIPDDWKTSSTAVNMGAPLCQHAPKSKLRVAYREMALALAGMHAAAKVAAPPAAGNDTKKNGLFGFLTGAKA